VARPTNSEDLALSDALAERGITARPRRLETMRQAGMLEKRQRSGLGRGRGSRAATGEDEVDRAEYMAQLLDQGGSYPDAVLAAFVQGRFPIAKDRLDGAYERSIRALLRRVERRGRPASSVLDSALNATPTIARPLTKERRFSPVRHRARHLGLVHRHAPMHRVMYDLATDVIVLTLMGDGDTALSTKAAAKLELLTGDGRIDGPSTEPPPASPKGLSFSELARGLHLEALPRLVRSATMEELVIARDSAKIFRAFAQVYAPFAERTGGTARAFPWSVIALANYRTVAWSIPAFVVLRRIHGARFDATIGFLADWTPFWAAANAFLDELPPRLQVVAQSDGYESLASNERKELSDQVTRLETTHANELEVIRNPPALTYEL
jgi:hypothetical protein